MFNKVILAGNLTKDPEVRYTPQGTPVGSFRIAVNTRVKVHGEWQDDVLFIDTVVFGKQAEACEHYLSKGSSVLVEGRLQERKWETEGQIRSKVEVVGQNVRFLKTDTSSEKGGADSDADSDSAPPTDNQYDPDETPF